MRRILRRPQADLHFFPGNYRVFRVPLGYYIRASGFPDALFVFRFTLISLHSARTSSSESASFCAGCTATRPSSGSGPDYETQPLRVPLTHDELAAKLSPVQVKTYTVEQLAVLYDYASPMERLLMLLALNCGFGAAEVTSLQRSELFLDLAAAGLGVPVS